MENKSREIWTKENNENVQHSLKVKTIITTRYCEYAKTIQGTLLDTHEVTTKIKRARVNILTHEYYLFRMKIDENITHRESLENYRQKNYK